MPRLIKDDGRRDARLVFCGEAPGMVEERMGRPFKGAAGAVQARWWRKVGLTRKDFYITNTYPYRPPDNDLGSVDPGERADWIEKLHDRIAALDDPRLIVPTGNYALQTFTGLSQISKRRGSIYEYTDRRGRKIKVIPTIHPAATFGGRNARWERRCVLDWQRIAEDVKFRELRLPEREHFIAPTFKDICDYVDMCRRATVLAIDIETPIATSFKVVGHTKKGTPKRKKIKGERFIACVGFAMAADFSITIPTTKAYWKGQLPKVWDLITELCGLPCAKVLHNGWFDTWHLAQRGIHVQNWLWDTMAMHHALIPNDENRLEYLCSIDTREPYYKDEGKGEDKGVPLDLTRYWTYNGKDCCVTWELQRTYEACLEKEGKLQYYHNHYRRLFRPVLQMSLEGINSDEQIRARRFAALTEHVARIRKRLAKRTGMELYGPKGGLSPLKLKELLYEKLGLPVKRKKNTKGEYVATTNEVAVRQLMIRHPEPLKRIGPLILKNRRLAKLSTYYAEKVADPDGRVRASYSFTPENGRFSCKQNPMGRGANLQNQDREARDHFIPDKGHIFLRLDLSQAESRIVYMLTGDRELIEKARSQPWEYDDHRAVAAIIFGIAEDEVTKEQRYFGKKTNHASNYAMSGKKGAEEILKDGYVISAEEFQVMIDRKMAARPEIQDVFQAETRRTIITDRKLSNSWGRTLDFTLVHITGEIFREGYSFRAASEVAGIINQYGIRPFWRWYRNGEDVRLRNQIHDELLISCTPESAWSVYQAMRPSLERPRMYRGKELTIPVTVKLGDSWSGGHEFARPPKHKAFEEVAHGLAK